MTITGEKPVYYVYVMSNNSGIYIHRHHEQSDPPSRRAQSRKICRVFKKNGTHKLVYYEEYQYVNDAIFHEKQIKTWRKKKKRKLIRNLNPRWEDLSADWLEGESPPAEV